MNRVANSASLYLRKNILYGTFDTILGDGRRAPLPDIIDFGPINLENLGQLAEAARNVLERSASYTNEDESWYTPSSYDVGAHALGFRSSSDFLSESILLFLSRDGDDVRVAASKRKGKKNPGFLGTQEFFAKHDDSAELGGAIKLAFEMSS